MSFALHPRRLVAAAAVGVCAVVGLAVVADASHAHPGKTYTITTLKARESVWIAAGRKAMSVGHRTPGNSLLETNDVRRSDVVLHKSGLAVSSSATPDAVPRKTVVLRRSGIVIPGSSKIEYRRALAATSTSSDARSSAASSNGDPTTLALVLICVGSVLTLCGATYLGARVVRRHRFASTRIA
jgi:hypothetical protein